ncbi:MAG: response regulator transcription factor, partial [Bacteroidota bacterium]
MSSRILIVEDEPSMRMGLSDNLAFEGYEVDSAGDGEKGLELALNNPYDLIVLDIMLPKKSGFDVCKGIRQVDKQTPILMLSAKGEEIDKVLGLELGADDYMTKPFGLRELLARIKAILRRSAKAEPIPDIASPIISVGALTVNFDAYTAKVGEEDVKLSHRAYEILQYLVNHSNEVVSRDDLLRAVWGYDQTPTTRTVDNFIVKLRQLVEENPADPRRIVTVHGVGYKLIMNE